MSPPPAHERQPNKDVLAEMSVRKAEEWRETLLTTISMAVATAFDAVEPHAIGKTVLDREASFLSTAGGCCKSENMCFRCRPRLVWV